MVGVQLSMLWVTSGALVVYWHSIYNHGIRGSDLRCSWYAISQVVFMFARALHSFLTKDALLLYEYLLLLYSVCDSPVCLVLVVYVPGSTKRFYKGDLGA